MAIKSNTNLIRGLCDLINQIAKDFLFKYPLIRTCTLHDFGNYIATWLTNRSKCSSLKVTYISTSFSQAYDPASHTTTYVVNFKHK